MHPVLQLLDQILLVAAVVGREGNLLDRQVTLVGDLKEAAVLLEELFLPLFDADQLALAMRRAKLRSVPTVYTAEQAWSRVKWPFKIVMIRPVRSGG